MVLDRARVAIGHQPQAGPQSFRLDIAGDPLRSFRIPLLVPLIDPVMPLRTELSRDAIVAVINRHVLKTVGPKMFSQPVHILHDIRFRGVGKVAGPTAPHHGRTVEDGGVHRDIPRQSEDFRIVVRNKPDRTRSRKRHPDVQLLRVGAHGRETSLGSEADGRVGFLVEQVVKHRSAYLSQGEIHALRVLPWQE